MLRLIGRRPFFHEMARIKTTLKNFIAKKWGEMRHLGTVCDGFNFTVDTTYYNQLKLKTNKINIHDSHVTRKTSAGILQLCILGMILKNNHIL